jgi:TetR/AcrR family transcriptional regulator
MKAPVRDAVGTRQALLDSGREVFSERGYDGARVEEIARRAGVNKAMISYHFAGKQGLYNAILSENFGWVLERLAELDREPLPADVKLARFVSIFGALHSRRPGLSGMMLREAMSAGRYLDPSLFSTLSRIFGSVQSIVAQGMAEKIFRDTDPLFTHHTVIGAIVFYFAARPLRDRLIAEGVIPVAPPDPERYIAHVQELLSRGLAKEA